MSLKQISSSILLGIFSVFFLFNHAFAVEKIQNYIVDIKINKDSSINVTESIEYDFGNERKHGIFRTIPLDFDDKYFDKDIEISNIKVTNSNGESRPFEIKDKGKKKKIKIGDPNKKITGTQTYNINYKVDWATRFFENHDELYWNAIGGNWEAPTEKAKVKVELPESINESDLILKCFVGKRGSKNECNSISTREEGKTKKIIFNHDNKVLGNEIFTIVVGFPKGIIEKPNTSESVLKILSDNWVLGVPILTLIIMLGAWFKYGRDPEGKGNIIAQYEPPRELSPLEMGMVVNSKIDDRDISAQMIHLANKGFLNIKYEEKDKWIGSENVFTLVKKKDPQEAKKSFDKNVLNLIFKKGFLEDEGKQEVKLSEIEPNKSALKSLKKEVISKMVDKGFYNKSPRKTRGYFMVSGFLLAFFSFFVVSSGIGILSFLITGFLIGFIGYFMPTKTKEGVLAEEEILGFKKYLSVAEKDRMEFHNAPEKKPEIFENYLPYAMALEVEEEWANIFEDVYDRQPEWYEGPANHAGAAAIASDMGSFSSGISSSAASSSGSSGASGGSAGGGAGGGGGGSW